jgi:hypothetical protein
MGWSIMSGRWNSGCNIKDVRKPSQRGAQPMDAGKGKSHDFSLSQALAYPVVKKGVFRSSRKWMIRLVEEFGYEVVTRVYVLKRGHSPAD